MSPVPQQGQPGCRVTVAVTMMTTRQQPQPLVLWVTLGTHCIPGTGGPRVVKTAMLSAPKSPALGDRPRGGGWAVHENTEKGSRVQQGAGLRGPRVGRAAAVSNPAGWWVKAPLRCGLLWEEAEGVRLPSPRR